MADTLESGEGVLQPRPQVPTAEALGRVRALGLGCFWFGQRRTTQGDFDPKTHLEQIKAALESVDNVSDVSVSGENLSFRFPDPGFISNDIDENVEITPIYNNVLIQFSIFMPDRLREKFGNVRSGDPDVDRFRVHVDYDYEMPIAYVSYDVEVEHTSELIYRSPSDAVIFIRKYLADKLSDDKAVTFHILGPSPFHADIFLTRSDSQKDSISSRDLSDVNRGYRTLLFEFPVDDENIVASFARAYHEILSSYYIIVQFRNRSNDLNSLLIGGTRELFAESTPGKVFGWFRARWKQAGRGSP